MTRCWWLTKKYICVKYFIWNCLIPLMKSWWGKMSVRCLKNEPQIFFLRRLWRLLAAGALRAGDWGPVRRGGGPSAGTSASSVCHSGTFVTETDDGSQGEPSPFYRRKNGSSSLQTKDERKKIAVHAVLLRQSLVSRLSSNSYIFSRKNF